LEDHGQVDKTKGKLKTAGGELTGDDSLKAEGRADKARGGWKGGVQKVADWFKGRR
jgi:uncharacterized protein YjbJ (UPF0337 family)